MTTRATMTIAATDGLRQMRPQLNSLDSLSRSLAVSMGPGMEALDSLSRSLAVSMGPSMEALDSLSRSLAVSMGPSMEALDSLTNLMSVSSNSVIADLQYDLITVPTYIPAQHLGSKPFRENTEQDGTDPLMGIRKSDLHPDVLQSCRIELSNGDYFHAVLEAIKGLCQKIRDLTGLLVDGSNLVEQAFAYKKRPPYIALNSLKTSSQCNVQDGFSYSLKGLILMYRNPLAHEPKITWLLGETEALSVLLQISEYHRRIDRASIRRDI